jgi:hypothetical protein
MPKMEDWMEEGRVYTDLDPLAVAYAVRRQRLWYRRVWKIARAVFPYAVSVAALIVSVVR